MAKITHGDVGDVWTPQATFTVGGTPTDPTNITVKIRDAAGTITPLGPVAGGTGGSGIVRVSAGIFNTLIPITASGYWAAQFLGTGTAAASEDHEFIADPSLFSSSGGLSTRALVGLQETKDWLNQQNVATENDLELVRTINDISERMHNEAGREFKVVGTNPQARVFDVDSLVVYRKQIRIGDLASAPTLVRVLDKDAVLVATVPAADYALLPRNREASEPIRRLKFNADVSQIQFGYTIEVTGVWGFPSVPGTVRQAALDAIVAVMDRDVEHYRQDQGVQAEPGGNVIMVGGGGQRMLSMPPGVLAVAWSFRDPSVG